MNDFLATLKFKYSGRNFRPIDHLVVCFDSDDWGSLKFSSIEQRNLAKSMGHNVSSEAFVRCDSLETPKDLQNLASVLLKHHDHFGNCPIFTLNFMMFNPDYSAMLQSNFSTFVHHPFFEAYGSDDAQKKVLSVLKSFSPTVFDFQLHGAQHLNVSRFLRDGKMASPLVLDACKVGVTNFSDSFGPNRQAGYMDELGCVSSSDALFVQHQLDDSLSLFNDVFGYRPHCLTPSCGVISSSFCASLHAIGINTVKISLRHYKPTKKDIHSFVALSNKHKGVSFIYRNVSFDPEVTLDFSQVIHDICLCNKAHVPCLISSHRLNYVGLFNLQNAQKNLELLDHLLDEIEKLFPNVEYLSTEKCISKYGKISQ
jgi:hypothetical protein